MTTTNDIVQKLWRLCDVLRDDGITYHQYVTELTWLLFLKMEQETRDYAQRRHYALPEGYRWEDLVSKTGVEQQTFYREVLLHLGTKTDGIVQAIYADAATSIRKPATLSKLVTAIDGLDWYDAKQEGLGDLYEGLLEKNAGEKKSGAGQYFTPRPLIDCMVALVKPEPGEVIQDPAAGTGGFLIAADRYMREQTDDYTHHSMTEQLQLFMEREAFYGVELVPEAHRLMLMNLMLHGIRGHFERGDSLSSLGASLPKADIILTNPPFGTKKGGGGPTRDDFTFPTSNKQLAFLQHIYRGLKPGGRAAIVLPDNVLFEENTGTKIRRDLMDKCDLHTILRLPTGIFYAMGVKTNVLFFRRVPVQRERDFG
jgi:type I restriction enzyme M protein